jgi:hypothetical protein
MEPESPSPCPTESAAGRCPPDYNLNSKTESHDLALSRNPIGVLLIWPTIKLRPQEIAVFSVPLRDIFT